MCSTSRESRAALAALLLGAASAAAEWTASEQAVIASLSLSTLAPVAADWRNPRAGDEAAVSLGFVLFNDDRLSGDGERACATCHDPARAFTDGQATASGRVRLTRNTPALAGSAHQRWQGWAGRYASPVAQAIAPLESPRELGGTRIGLARLIATDARMRSHYEAVAGPVAPIRTSHWPTRASPGGNRREQRAWQRLSVAEQTTIDEMTRVAAESLAAYVASLAPTRSRLDDALGGQSLLKPRERRGLALFIGTKAGCVQCHSGPLLSDGKFHNIGTRAAGSGGRRADLNALINACQSGTAVRPADCAILRDAAAAEVPALLAGAFRTPSLRAVARTAPHMHDGRFATLEAVLDHYRNPPAKSAHPHELPASLSLTDQDAADLAAFLRTL